MPSRILAAVRTVAVCVAAVALAGVPSNATTGRVPGLELTGAARSETELIDRLLGALSARDPDALHALRATESEWKAMLAWQVPVGARPRVLREEVRDLAWQMVDSKSLHYERHLLHQYGGRDFDVKAVSFDKGTTEWTGFRVHRQVRLDLVADGTEVELGTGSIVEIAGRFKFASFIRD